MYAAAGGASIASRKARQNKAQGKTAAAAKKPPPKKQVPKGQPQSKQFHHLPENYHKSDTGGLVPPNVGLPHSRSMTLRPGDSDSSGMRPCRSAHELPVEDGMEKPPQSTLPVGSPPRAYSCTHWESRLQKTPPERIVGFGSADVPYAVCEVVLNTKHAGAFVSCSDSMVCALKRNKGFKTYYQLTRNIDQIMKAKL